MKCTSLTKWTCQQLCAVIWKSWLPILLYFIEICKTPKPRVDLTEQKLNIWSYMWWEDAGFCARSTLLARQRAGFTLPSSADNVASVLRQITHLLAALSAHGKYWQVGRENQAEVFREWRTGFPDRNA